MLAHNCLHHNFFNNIRRLNLQMYQDIIAIGFWINLEIVMSEIVTMR